MSRLQALLPADGFIFVYDYGRRGYANDATVLLQARGAVAFRYRLGAPVVHCQCSGRDARLGVLGKFVCPHGEEVAVRVRRGEPADQCYHVYSSGADAFTRGSIAGMHLQVFATSARI